uniref:G-type lectin S-receptor-like serine/threonine-protein kinase SD2-5 n=1 Tax=Erigeron canadensis TaxID=72917 RepID=UPI001CB8B829|nr:G-type lectin S-receptor-like serine/threonine-protein kinase SD2-5 [Erigeron canadensis]
MMAPWINICYCFALFLFFDGYPTTAQPYPATANLSTTWTTHNDTLDYEFCNTKIQPILHRESFACGFYCNGTCTSYLFAVFFVETNNSVINDHGGFCPQVVWSANREYPVSIIGTKLKFTKPGDLVLGDVDGSTVWTTNTTGKSVVGMNLTDTGNLVLFAVNGSVVWQSFDYPTDCLLPGQILFPGQQLIPSVSSTNWTAQKGLFSLQVTDDDLVAYVGSNPRRPYYRAVYGISGKEKIKYVAFLNGLLSISFSSAEHSDFYIEIPAASSAQYMKFMPDGHLTVFEIKGGEWSAVADLLTNKYYGECSYPLACGRNALCTNKQQCICPASSPHTIDYFRPVLDRQPNLGCTAITPLTCNATQDHAFISLPNVSFYQFIRPHMKFVSMETCKQACLHNCSCKAAVFEHVSDFTDVRCLLYYDLFTMINVEVDAYHSVTAFIKVQNVKSKKKSKPIAVVIASTIVSILVLLVVVVTFLYYKPRSGTQIEEDYIDMVPGMPTRFTYEELQTATQNFCKKLGQGGFGSVFEGTLEDDSKIAVKCLDGLGQVNKSFLAEVESIGSIHHVNLVRLRGFGAWKSQRFLVYDFMSNGSLDKWIYHGNGESVLGWECRKKIILDIAKGLAYLHEDCRQKIIHLDIKPQNILIDEDFNAKVSDFGLSKLIDRDQSHVTATMRGTPGYMAPEWLSSVITEKVDVYSFGIVLLEILCGRKNFDRSQPEESWHLLDVFQKCWEQGTLLDIVDKYSEDMQTHGSEVVEMMKVASWCLQTNFTRRPPMSSVVNVLEGRMDVESNLDYKFTDPRLQNPTIEHKKDVTPLLASVLSGPRDDEIGFNKIIHFFKHKNVCTIFKCS